MKIGMDDFFSCVNMYDVVFISETWANEMSEIGIEGFSQPFCKFRKRKRFAKRDSGGLSVYFRKEFIAGVEEIEWVFEDGLLFKLKGSFFGWTEDIYLFCVYMRSDRSTRENINDGINCYDELMEQLTRVPNNADIIVVGDMNARVSNKKECFLELAMPNNGKESENCTGWMETVSERMITEEDLIMNDMSITRENMDKTLNDYCYRMMNMCNAADLCMLNGRAFKDKGIGNFTFCNEKGMSTIDFVLVSKYALYKICHFEVSPFIIFSDHSAVSFDIKINMGRKHDEINAINSLNKPKLFTKWNPEYKEDYCCNLNKEENVLYINHLIEQCASVESHQGVEECIQDFTGILLKTGANHTKTFKINNSGNKNESGYYAKKKEGWYDKECFDQSNVFKEFEIRYWYTGLEEDRIEMCQQRNIYRRLCRDKKRIFHQAEALNLLKLSKTNTKEFWNKIKGKGSREKAGNCDFYQHFKNLANMESRVGEEGKREVEGESFENYHNESEILDKPIDMKELDTAIKGLKCNKSSGHDNIVNEFFINASVVVKLFILILFNKILELECFPASWAVGKIVPVFKKGDKNDANNYRGITIISCLAKLFTKIMNDRLNTWVDSQQILTDAQYGFRKKRSTVDCLFIIQGFIDIILAKGLKLYVCFIDYEKAYDLIDRSCLFHKLVKLNVSSKCINIFKDMYSKMKLTLDCDLENNNFSSNVGLLQGESTSPLLFSLFVNDLENNICNQDFGIHIVNTLIKVLMFADDMAIFSSTIDGLQTGINSLSRYCSKWGLTVNINKTKIVIFKRGGRLGIKEKWWFNGSIVEVVPSFKYLGCVLSSSGSYTNCITSLVSSARRALFCLKKFINNNSEILPTMQLELFSLKISPILNYGSEVWGLRKADAIDVFYLSFLKTLLGVKSSTPNCFVYGELGVYPMIIERKVRVIKFWLKILKSLNNNENYVQKIYKELITINIEFPMHVTWVSQLKNLLETCGLGYAWQNQFIDNETQFISLFKQRVRDIFVQDWAAQVALTSNNRLYKSIKHSFNFESYLNLNNRALRVAITKVRLSSHLFHVERGRWGKTRIEFQERICSICITEVEDEFHCLIKCPRFNNERRGLLTNYLILEPSEANFVRYLKTNNKIEQKKLGLLCMKILKEYRELA